MNTPEELSDTSCGFIALVGAPNAGKSTLLNSLVGTKVSIVTHKAQTTRSQVRGVVTLDKAQLVFIDTPGIFAPKRRLDRAMVDSAWGGAGDADIVALIVDVDRGLTPDLEKLIEGLENVNHPRILILNKIDTIKNEELLKLSEAINARLRFEATFAGIGIGPDRGIEKSTVTAKCEVFRPVMVDRSARKRRQNPRLAFDRTATQLISIFENGVCSGDVE